MKRSDKILIGIVIGIVLLIIATFLIVMTRPDPTYQPDTTPEGVVHNYLLALQTESYEKAYSYLSPELQGYPADVDAFITQLDNYSWTYWRDQPSSIVIKDVSQRTATAIVTVQETSLRGGSLLDSGQSIREFEVHLSKVDEQWKITDSSYYFSWCWDREDGCK